MSNRSSPLNIMRHFHLHALMLLMFVAGKLAADEPMWQPVVATPQAAKPPAVSLEDRLRDVEAKLQLLQQQPVTPVSAVEPIASPAVPCPPVEASKNPKMEGSWKNALWFESKDKAFRFNVGGVIQYDTSFFGGAQNVISSIGTFNNLADPNLALQDGFSFRRARLRFAGNLYEQVEFFAQYEFAQALDLRRRTLGLNTTTGFSPAQYDFDPGDGVGFNEVYLGLVDLPHLGTFRVGRMRESLNFVTATSDTNQVWMERGLMFDAFNGDFNFSNGMTLQNSWMDDRLYMLLGWFHSNNFSNRGFYAVGDGDYAYDGRITGMLIDDKENKRWMHVGADYSYRVPYQSQVRYRARPMIRSGPSFLTPSILNTGAIFTQDSEQIANLEFAMAFGRVTFAAEAAASWMNNAWTGGLPLANGVIPAGVVNRGSYVAGGGYVEALCFLTPDHRPYRKERPGYDRVVPTDTFYCMNGEKGQRFGTGAWEVGMRYDYLDLINNGINGGIGHAMTFCVNWYLNPNARVQMNYSWMNREFAPADLAGRVDGPFQAFGLRFNSDF